MAGVALVFPYFRSRSRHEILFPPLGIAALAGQLRRHGVETHVLDCTFSSLPALRAELKRRRPDVVGISSMVSLTATTKSVAALVREILPEALLVAGGPLPTVFPRRFTPFVDAVVRGEAEVSFPRLCADYLAGGAPPRTLADLPLTDYAGLYAVAGGRLVDNAAAHHGEAQRAGFALPDRRDFDHASYQRVWQEREGHKVSSIITTFGCPYACEFCSKPVFGNTVRRRALDAVLAEIDDLRDLGYDSLWVADDLFTLSRAAVEEFCRHMVGRGMTWTCLARADRVDAATARHMRRAGCRRVYLGLESGCQATLDLMKKNLAVGDGVHAAHVYREAGIEVAAFFIVGYPGETVASIESTFSLALSLPLNEISFNVPMPLPGSALFERLGGPDDGRDWRHENDVTFVYASDVDEQWLRRRIDETMTAFALRRDRRAGKGATQAPRARRRRDSPCR